MSDDNNSNDVVMVESNEEDSRTGEVTSSVVESRPIMQLFLRLISNDNKQNTVLTNAQIISILDKEFAIDISTLHDLEVDIYINIVKRFLKDWPQWDEFDRGINWLRKQNAHSSIKQTLETKYIDLKQYLQVQLEATKPLAKETVDKMLKDHASKLEKVNTSDIVLEIYCSRKQLNELVCNRPNPALENNIFNVADNTINTVSLNKIPLESIFNWWGIKVTLETKYFSLTRTTMHQIKHVLVNTRNGPRMLNKVLNERIQIKKDQKRQTEDINKNKICKLLDVMLQNNSEIFQMYSIIYSLFNMIKSDLAVFDKDIKVPATYRKHSNKYPYYRKLQQVVNPNVQTSGNLYDLYIEETLAPMEVIHIGKVDINQTKLLHKDIVVNSEITMIIECVECKSKFSGIEIYTLLQDHFEIYHLHEPDWLCTNCKKSFTMIELTQNKWRHICFAQ